VNEASQAALYGGGVFTTIRIIDGEPWLWEKHWSRLKTSADRLGIGLGSQNVKNLRGQLQNAIRNQVREGVARVTLHDEGPAALWNGDDQPTSVSILVRRPKTDERPFRITFSPHLINSTSPLAGLKTCNYLEQIMSVDEARSRGFNEATRINERGHVAGACMANVFWLKRDRLFTPALSTGCLPGTTREFVLENLECEEVEAAIGEIENADAIFLTSAGIGVVAVDELNGRKLSSIDHPVTRLLTDKI